MSFDHYGQGLQPISAPISAVLRDCAINLVTRLHRIAADRRRGFDERIEATRKSNEIWRTAVLAGVLHPLERPWLR